MPTEEGLSMVFPDLPGDAAALYQTVDARYLADETACVESLLDAARRDEASRRRAGGLAADLVRAVRARTRQQGSLDAFLHEYDLSSREGVVLMCLAEALLRIPDDATADRLIVDQLAKGNWSLHQGQSPSLFVNASTWGLMLTGNVVRLDPGKDADAFLRRLLMKGGEPLIRLAFRHAMRIMAEQFVLGRTIEEAVVRSSSGGCRDFRYSFDMLGEAALTANDAARHFDAHLRAIAVIGAAGSTVGCGAPSISVKLSALHPRYEFAQRQRVLRELAPRLAALARLARDADIGLTVDAEEAERLGLSLEVFLRVYADAGLAPWEGFGLAVQAYQKRAPAVLEWLRELARSKGRRIPVRLVKGAYWDSEIKRAQQGGWDGYSVYTRKASTDLAYLVCARLLLESPDAFHPQFATHNAHTVAAVLEAGAGCAFEFQRLQGMGEALYRELPGRSDISVPCRVYAPVGSHEDLLPYLVRRLLENGANTSFVNRLENERAPVEAVVADPVAGIAALAVKPNPRIPLPRELYPDRRNSRGPNLTDRRVVQQLDEAMRRALSTPVAASPLIAGTAAAGQAEPLYDPADRRRVVGSVMSADGDAVRQAVTVADRAAGAWAATAAGVRAGMLERAADLIEQHSGELLALCVREAGRTVPDAVAELREAIDFCRYYALRARGCFADARVLAGPTGERNELRRFGRGVFGCISPWNFPLAIFTGQVAAALVSGNAVIAKPAEQTPLVAFRVVQLLHGAGVPPEVLHFVPGPGKVLGSVIATDRRISGVAFTGSTDTAQWINRALGRRGGPIIPFIAETGGQNAMVVDSSALPEQVVRDVLRSAFNSAGQRCSALRVLFLQQDIADRIIDMLAGAMAELRVGDPLSLATDIGPLIDEAACARLKRHTEEIDRYGRLIYRTRLAEETRYGSFFAPCAYEIDGLHLLKGEVFGPVLHVIRYPADRLDAVIEAINGTGYGLTFGVHSRIEERVRYLQSRVKAGNCYVNRDMIGAVVGLQPFGGEGLSGTGPKAGGPDYLLRFAVERTVSVNTAAVGGNADLLGQHED